MKIYTWRDLLGNMVGVRCPEEWMREQILDYAFNEVGDNLWEYYKDDLHVYGVDSVFYVVESSSKRVKYGAELMLTDSVDAAGDFELIVDYEQSECYQIYNAQNINLENFEAILLED